MFSPYKLTAFENNSFEIASNLELANKLEQFFLNPQVDFLWNISTSRQRMAEALKHTKMVALRQPVPPPTSKLTSTNEWNQITTISDSKILTSHPLFQELVKWLKDSLLAAGASNVEFGRIFFSNHAANSEIGLHTDEGAYFDHYDRFHFVIDQEDNKNVFRIREEDVLLQKGKLYWVNNHVPHCLKNSSSKDRINLIFDARLS
jgi:hypothetical protein